MNVEEKMAKIEEIISELEKDEINLDDQLNYEKNNTLFNDENKDNKENKIKIGLYAAGLDWRKNMYTQLASTALIENVIVDSVPLKFESEVFASHLNIDIDGIKKGVKREDLLARLAKNDINLYVTFSECAPMLPILPERS